MAAKTKKHKQAHGTYKKMLIILFCLLIIILVPAVSAAAYTGFVPGATELMNTNKPVDLGVRYSAANFKQIQNSTNNLTLNVGNFSGGSKSIETVSPGKDLVIYGANTTRVSLSQEELTAFLNMVPWTGSPLSNSQLRLGDNNIFEFSGNVSATYVADLLKTVYPANNYGQLGFVAKLASHLHNPAVYLKAQISSDTNGDNNQGDLHFKLLALKVNRTDFSKDINTLKQVNIKTGHGSYDQGIAYSLASLSITNGQLSYYGNAPANFAVGDGDPGVICSGYHGGSLVLLSAAQGRIGSVLKYCK